MAGQAFPWRKTFILGFGFFGISIIRPLFNRPKFKGANTPRTVVCPSCAITTRTASFAKSACFSASPLRRPRSPRTSLLRRLAARPVPPGPKIPRAGRLNLPFQSLPAVGIAGQAVEAQHKNSVRTLGAPVVSR